MATVCQTNCRTIMIPANPDAPGLIEDTDDDADGTPDIEEDGDGTDSANPDTDGDGMCDGPNAVAPDLRCWS